MISYKDKLLFLSFIKIINIYLRIIEDELDKEALSLTLCKKNIPSSLSSVDTQYACNTYDNMLSQNYQFKQMLKHINSDILSFFSSTNFTLSSITSDNVNSISLSHLKDIEDILSANQI